MDKLLGALFNNPIYLLAMMAILIVVLVILLVTLTRTVGERKTPWKRAGNRGEEEAAEFINRVLTESDVMLRNVGIEIEKTETELDYLIVNEFGVHIIEVKNYVGILYGEEEDQNWKKIKVTRAGNEYAKSVRNPIKQVKRQIYLLAEYLKENDIRVWVSGYVLLMGFNSPVHNEYILDSIHDIDKAIHTKEKQHLSKETIDRIVSVILDL